MPNTVPTNNSPNADGMSTPNEGGMSTSNGSGNGTEGGMPNSNMPNNMPNNLQNASADGNATKGVNVTEGGMSTSNGSMTISANGTVGGMQQQSADGMQQQNADGNEGGMPQQNGCKVVNDRTYCPKENYHHLTIGGIMHYSPKRSNEGFKDYNKGDTQKLILESCLFGCLFYIVSHNKFSDLFKKAFGKVSKDNMNIVLMFVFLVIYYLINYLI